MCFIIKVVISAGGTGRFYPYVCQDNIPVGIFLPALPVQVYSSEHSGEGSLSGNSLSSLTARLLSAICHLLLLLIIALAVNVLTGQILDFSVLLRQHYMLWYFTTNITD